MQKFKNFSLFLLPLLLLFCGLYFVPLTFLGTDLSLIPGDLGDARFNNYILEHGHKFFSGQIDKFWDAPFMYPYANVTALSDNLLGTLPVYSVFRIFSDRETALQLWILALFALNFVFCYFALNKWSKHILLSSVGSYIYAFSIFTVTQIGHLQVLPRFIIPLVIYWCWRYLSEKKIKYFLFVMLGIAYQLYCGVYLGFLLIYVILFFSISYLIIYKDRGFFLQFKNVKKSLQHFGVLFISVCILFPMLLPYWEVSKTMGMRPFDMAFSSIPRLRSYFFTSPASKTWSPLLYDHSSYKFPDWWNHFLFIGGLPWLGVLALPFVFFSKKITANTKKIIGFFAFALFLSVIFCLNINGFTLFKFIFMIPGFSSMRSIDRVINTEIILFVLLFVFVFKELYYSSKIFKWVVLCFPVLVILDNMPQDWGIKKFDKADAIAQVKETKSQIEKQYQKQYAAIHFVPVSIDAKDTEAAYFRNVVTQLNVMLAAQELNIPSVNGYSGFYPGNYEDLFFNPNDKTLSAWCDFEKINIDQIQRINELGKKEKSRRLIHLKTSNNKFVSAIEGEKPVVLADKDKADSWETFLLINFENGESVLRSNSNLFFSAQLDGDGEVSASRSKVAEWETFTITDLGNDTIAIKAINGKYWSLDGASQKILVNPNSIGQNERFFVITK